MGKKRGERWGKKYEDKRDWKEYNEELVRRGELYLSLDFLDRWDEEIRKMNKGKRGRPFRFPEAFVEWMGLIHVWFFMPFRQMEGFLRALSQYVPVEPADYTTLFKRTKDSKLDLSSTVEAGEDVVIAVDSTGVRVTNRGEWMREKWNNHRGWIKVHLSVDVESKQILGLKLTNEEVSDADMFPSLLEQSKANSKGIKRVLGDGAYDDRAAFNLLKKHSIESGDQDEEQRLHEVPGIVLSSPMRERKTKTGAQEMEQKEGLRKTMERGRGHLGLQEDIRRNGESDQHTRNVPGDQNKTNGIQHTTKHNMSQARKGNKQKLREPDLFNTAN